MLSSLPNYANRMSHIARACLCKPLKRYFNELKPPAQFAHRSNLSDDDVNEGESSKYTPPRPKLATKRDPSPLRLPHSSIPNAHGMAQPQSRSLLFTSHVALRDAAPGPRHRKMRSILFQSPLSDDEDSSWPVLPDHPPRLAVQASFEPQLKPLPCNPALMPALSLEQPPRPDSSKSRSSLGSNSSTFDLPLGKRQPDAEELSMSVRPDHPPRLTVQASFEPQLGPPTPFNAALMPAFSLEQPPRPASSKFSSFDSESDFDLELSLEQPPRPDVDESFEAYLPSASPRDIELMPASSIRQPPRPKAETCPMSIDAYLQLHLPLEPVPHPPRPSVHKSFQPQLSPPAKNEVLSTLSFPLPQPPRPDTTFCVSPLPPLAIEICE